MEMSAARSQTTRLLCASAFLAGAKFRKQVLEFLEDTNRAAAPELGADLKLVGQVCEFARNRERRFEMFYLVCWAVSMVATFANPVFGLVVFVLASTVVCFAKMWPERSGLVQPFTKTVFDPEKVAREYPGNLKPEQYGSLPAEDQNLIVYQGFSPFVGAGITLGGWSFLVNVENGKEEAGEELEPIKFQMNEIYSQIERSIDALGLSGLSQRDMFYVHGSDIRDDRNILPNAHARPVQKIDTSVAQKYIFANDPHIRHYRWIKVMDWGNDLTTSYFLRCSLRGKSMFVEINRYLLTPLAEAYRKVDAMPRPDFKKRLGIGLLSLVVGPVMAVLAPYILLGRMGEFIAEMFGQKEKHRKELIDQNPLYNYGVVRSFREWASSDHFMHYFQKLDGDFYSKILEREILAAIVDFLDEHNIDTSELKERQSTILNSGIIIHGGDVKAESLAVGTGAQSTKATTSAPSRKPKLRRAAAGVS